MEGESTPVQRTYAGTAQIMYDVGQHFAHLRGESELDIRGLRFHVLYQLTKARLVKSIEG